jgi:DNA helicase HerA-like ATPase
MSQQEQFISTIKEGYTSKGKSLVLGVAMLNGKAISDAAVAVPLKTLNRHGLIAGATGTGKTKTIQVLSEQLSGFGIPVLMMDIKGDFSGIAMKGEEKSFITERHTKINIPFEPKAYPVELLTLSE